MDLLRTLDLTVAVSSLAIGTAMVGLVIGRGGEGITLGLAFGSVLIVYGLVRIKLRGR
ncbi:MAG: hypothetical protein AABX40_03585 [Candidatus Hydrothermarchaeota archaeon]